LREVAGDLQIAMVLLRTRRPARAGTFRLWCALLVCNSAGLLLSPLHTASVPARASSPCLFGGGSSAKPSKASRQKAAKPSTKRPAAAAGEAKKKPWEASEDVVKQREAILKVFKSGAAVARARKAEREEAEQDAPALRFGGRAQPPASPPPPAAKRLESQGVNQRKERLLAERSKLQAEVGAAEAAASGGFELGEFASMCAELIAAKAQLAVQQQVDGLVRSANEAAEAIAAAPAAAAEMLAAAPAAAAAAVTAEAGKAQAKLTASMDEALGSIAAAPAKTQAKLAASIEAAASEIQELPNKVSNTVKGELEAAQQKAEAQLEKAKSSIPRKP